SEHDSGHEMADDRWQSEALRQVTEYHGNDEHQPELGYKQNKGRACHVFTYFLYAYARDRHTVPATHQRYGTPRRPQWLRVRPIAPRHGQRRTHGSILCQRHAGVRPRAMGPSI